MISSACMPPAVKANWVNKSKGGVIGFILAPKPCPFSKQSLVSCVVLTVAS